MAILKIKQPNGSWAIVGDTSETIKFTEQQLTDEQKQVARENIGAISVEINETPKDGAILVYDATLNKLVNSGYTIDTFKQWVRDYVEIYMSTEITIDDNGNQILSVTGKETVIDNPDGSQTLIIGG